MNSTTNDGEKMERQMWEDIKAKNWKAVEDKIAEGFQSVHPDGARDRANEISLIKNLSVGQVEFNDFRSTMSGDNIVVTSMIAVQATIGLERLPAKPTPSLRLRNEGTEGWQRSCPANRDTIPSTAPVTD